MPLVNVRIIEGVFSPEQKAEIIHGVTEAMVAVEGENLRDPDHGPRPGSLARFTGVRHEHTSVREGARRRGSARGHNVMTKGSRGISPPGSRRN